MNSTDNLKNIVYVLDTITRHNWGSHLFSLLKSGIVIDNEIGERWCHKCYVAAKSDYQIDAMSLDLQKVTY